MRPRAERDNGEAETVITLAGCIQREADYRRATGSGTGGAGGFGLGLGNEFVLIDAVRAGTAPAPSPREGSTVNDIAAEKSPCGGSGGEAFELTGPQESELGRFAGRRVEDLWSCPNPEGTRRSERRAPKREPTRRG